MNPAEFYRRMYRMRQLKQDIEAVFGCLDKVDEKGIDRPAYNEDFPDEIRARLKTLAPLIDLFEDPDLQEMSGETFISLFGDMVDIQYFRFKRTMVGYWSGDLYSFDDYKRCAGTPSSYIRSLGKAMKTLEIEIRRLFDNFYKWSQENSSQFGSSNEIESNEVENNSTETPNQNDLPSSDETVDNLLPSSDETVDNLLPSSDSTVL